MCISINDNESQYCNEILLLLDCASYFVLLRSNNPLKYIQIREK